MKVIILCAGSSTRTPLASKSAQPALLPVKGKPVIEHILNRIQGLDNVGGVTILTNAGFHDHFKTWLNGYNSTVPVTILHNEKNNGRDCRGACADLRYVIDKQSINEDVLVIGGDNLFNFTLNDFIAFAGRLSDSVTTGAFNPNGSLRPKKYSLLKLDGDDRVVDFCEKPLILNGLRLISICLYYIPKEKLPALAIYAKEHTAGASLGSYLEWLVKTESVKGYTFQGQWYDVSDEEAYSEAVFSF
jgi:glucose-1-phosphate thymidylyltransferase